MKKITNNLLWKPQDKPESSGRAFSSGRSHFLKPSTYPHWGILLTPTLATEDRQNCRVSGGWFFTWVCSLFFPLGQLLICCDFLKAVEVQRGFLGPVCQSDPTARPFVWQQNSLQMVWGRQWCQSSIQRVGDKCYSGSGALF